MSSRSHRGLIADDIVFDIDTEYQIPYLNCLCTMASKNEISESRIVSGESNGNRDTIDKSAIVGDETESKEEISGLSGIDDLAAIPKGTIDPVYEAKARVLNHAVHSFIVCKPCARDANQCPDSRNWHGMVSMATLHCCWIWLGERQSVADCHLSHL